MILLTVSAKVHADKRDEALAAAEVVRAATLPEDGCISYRLYSATDEPNTFLMFEQWRDAAALTAHAAQPHVAEFGKVLGACVDGAIDLKRYEVPDPV